jgi:DNA-binding CsgD family transcriptional regulator
MSKRKGRWDPPLPGPPSNTGPQVATATSDDEKAGKPLPPLVEIILAPPPGGEHPHARAVSSDREKALSSLQAAFGLLTDDELRIAQLWLVGRSRSEVCHLLRLDEDTVQTHWRNMRRKLRDALKGNG